MTRIIILFFEGLIARERGEGERGEGRERDREGGREREERMGERENGNSNLLSCYMLTIHVIALAGRPCGQMLAGPT